MKRYRGYILTEGKALTQEDIILLTATPHDLDFRQAALDAIEITELKRELQDQLQIHEDHAHMEALASCGLCTCMELLVDGRCEMCDPPTDGELGEIDDGLNEWDEPDDGY